MDIKVKQGPLNTPWIVTLPPELDALVAALTGYLERKAHPVMSVSTGYSRERATEAVLEPLPLDPEKED